MSSTVTAAIRTQYRTIDGLRIRFAESEQRADHALLLSPWPESLFAFDQMWGRLSAHAHLVGVDLPGFGHSDRRGSLLAPRAMGEFVIRVADEFGLDKPHAVGPDIGTGALLFAAADNPGRLRSLVVGSGGASYPLELGGILNDWVVAPNLDSLRSIDPRLIVGGALSGLERYELPDTVREDYLSAYDGDRFVEAARYVRAYPTELPILAELLPHIDTPVQFRRATTASSTGTCPTASSTSSIPATSRGRTQPTRTQTSSRPGGPVATTRQARRDESSSCLLPARRRIGARDDRAAHRRARGGRGADPPVGVGREPDGLEVAQRRVRRRHLDTDRREPRRCRHHRCGRTRCHPTPSR
jgi:pimeloyl-ACP methyl ester carboxylesterase